MFSVKKIVVLGGGTAGWSAAALLAHQYQGKELHITVIESPNISPVGVGEATVPAILNVHNKLEIDEREFLKKTQATFKLGIQFNDWNKPNSSFFHPFSEFGLPIENVDFHQCWVKLKKAGINYNLEDFSLCTNLAKSGKFSLPDNTSQNSIVWHGYAYHFDASLYAEFLRQYSESFGVEHIENTVVSVTKNSSTGNIEKLIFEDGKSIEADLFVDCSGFSSLLIEKEYLVGYEDWSHWLPCDRALAVQTESGGELPSYTATTAMSAGWRWKIPLQQRNGNGYVYSSSHIDDEAAREEFLSTLNEPMINEPRVIKFKAGMRTVFWKKNCVAVGLSSGFIEPLESTSISLMHTGVGKLIAHMPDLVVREEAINRANELNRMEYERIRDFIILHYWASKRDDSKFWRDVRSMELPESLQLKLNAFQKDGSVMQYEQESFQRPSWLSMYNGYEVTPQNYASEADKIPLEQLENIFERLKNAIAKGVDAAPTQSEFLNTI